jgi:hypothetical protein
MSKTRIKIFRNAAVTLLTVAVIGLTSCEKYIWDPPTYIPPDTTGGFDTIYFNTDVAPLFGDHNCTNCHKNGGQSPNLTPDNTYAALTNGFINVDDPPSSEIITKIESGHMGGMPFDDTKIILDWIYQGGENYIKQ